MDLQTLTYLVVGASFALYIGIAIASRASSTGEFYVAGGGVHPVANGLATAADWMSAASFISMAGLIAFLPSWKPCSVESATRLTSTSLPTTMRAAAGPVVLSGPSTS